MYHAHLDIRPNQPHRYAALLVVVLLACIGTPTRAAPMQDAAPLPAASPLSPGASAPGSGTLVNTPREPDRLSQDQLAQHSLMTDREQLLSYSILLFGLCVLVVQYLLLRSPKRNSYEILQLLAINLIVTGTLFLISAGFSAQQISPGLGLFGTIAGYVLGRRAGAPPKDDVPTETPRGAT